MEIKINDTTRQAIDKLALELRSVIRKRVYENVTPLRGVNDTMLDIAALTLQVSRESFQLMSFNICEDGLYGFHNVGMHTDSINPKGAVVLLIPIVGKGTFYHYGLKIKSHRDVTETKFNQHLPRAVIFDDALPHTFIAETNCAALVFAIRVEKLSEIKSLDIIT